MTEPDPRPPRDSEVTLNQLMLLGDANSHGNIHGGVIMKMVDEAGAICAMRHAKRPCVTVAIDSMRFHSPVHVGELLRCQACVTWTGRTSIEVMVSVEAEQITTGRITHTNSAYLVYVALDEKGRPTPVPPVNVQSEPERTAWQRAEERRRQRLARPR